MAHANPDLPQIYRHYHWTDSGFLCEAAWENSREPWCAMQIFAIPSGAQVQVDLHPAPGLPLGFGLFQIPTVLRIFPPPVPGVTVDGKAAHIRYGESSQKIGLPAASLCYQLHGANVTVSRVESDAVAATLPDEGLVTQVYVGEASNPFIELEQLSSIRPASKGRQSFAIRLCPN